MIVAETTFVIYIIIVIIIMNKRDIYFNVFLQNGHKVIAETFIGIKVRLLFQ